MPGLPNDAGTLPSDAGVGSLPGDLGTTTAASFPVAVTLHAATYARGATGAPLRTDGAGVDCPASIKLETPREYRPTYPGEGDAVGSVTTYVVKLPGPTLATAGQLAAIEALRADDTIVTAAPPANWFPSMQLKAVGPAVPVVSDGTYQVRCEHAT